MPSTTSLAVIGGFLGAGKTTALLALAQHYLAAGQRVGVIANDQAEHLVDTETFRASGLHAAEVAGGCFCCRFDDFIAKADELIARVQPDVILAEPVGSCTDIVATVINPLKRLFPDRFAVAPYVVLVDPFRALAVLAGTEPVRLSERVTYVYRMQQQESDVIAVTKIDLLTPAQREQVIRAVGDAFPGREVIAFSARSGEGLDRLVAALESRSGHTHAVVDLDYDRYAEGEAELGWMNWTIRCEAPGAPAMDACLLQLADMLRAQCLERAVEVAHAKVMASAPGASAVVNIVGSHRAPEMSRRSGRAASSFELTMNIRAQTDPVTLETIATTAVAAWARHFNLRLLDGSGRVFSPARPVPTHRLTGTDDLADGL